MIVRTRKAAEIVKPSVASMPAPPKSLKPADQPPAWITGELADPHSHAEKSGKVRRMFAAIAGSYDLNNRIHSMGQDVRWRRFAVRAAQVRPGQVVLDVACGTGDLAQAFARTPARSVIGADFTREMLNLAVRKRERLAPNFAAKIAYLEADAHKLPLADGSVDVVSIAFGLRNVQEPERALREFARVLRPSGRVIILEFDRPQIAVVRWLTDFYRDWIMPRTAAWISRDKSGAYKYLPRSVTTFAPRSEIHAMMARAGLVRVESWTLSCGICACYRAFKP